MSSMYVDGKINDPDKVDQVKKPLKSCWSDGVSPNVRYIVRSVFVFVFSLIALRIILILLGLTFLVACSSSCSRKVILHGKGLHADSLYYETKSVLKMREK